MIQLYINDKHELLALHRTLMEAKFHPEPNLVPECQGSPFVANIANHVCDKLIELEQVEGNETKASEWLSWRIADLNRRETLLLIDRISKAKWWAESDVASKKKYIADFMAPLTLSEEIINELLQAHC